MPEESRDSNARTELITVIRQVRNRWRLKLTLRGAVIVLSGGLFILLLSASGLEVFKFSSPAVVAFRILTVAVVIALSAYWLVRPLLRRVTDTQVALYLEEHEPSLEAAILSAIDLAADRRSGQATNASPVLVERLVRLAIEKCRLIGSGRRIEREILRRHVVSLTGAGVLAALLMAFGPAYLRHGVSALLLLSRNAEAASPYRIEVRPGNATVPRGADQAVSARLFGFSSNEVDLMMRAASDAAFERVPLVAGADPSAFQGILFKLERPLEYFVQSTGVRSPMFTLKLVDLPAVSRIELEYHFPAYTGLPARKVETGGDVAALLGTEVRLRVIPTRPTPGGRILLNGSGSPSLFPQSDGTLVGHFEVERNGFYRIELEGPHGERVAASPQYIVDVLEDQTPSVSFTKPGRDTSASPVEEVFVEARADDDFGVKELQLVYAVNGGPERIIRLFGGASRPLPEVSAAHAFYLEDLELHPGDFISYYARATDNDGVRGSKAATSDIYFVQIRPFRKDYKPAESQAGGGGAGGEVGALSQQQRQIVAGTFNVVRDRKKTSPDKYRENVVFLTLAQARLREQVEELAGKMASRLMERDEAFKKIAEALPKAAEEMRSAEADLQAQNAKNALSPEQRALKFLQEAEQEYELQVSAGGNAGGAGDSAFAEDLADLFDLELDKLANQYEMLQRAEQQKADRQLDELLERLKELARRQQQEAERQRRLAPAGANASGGSSRQRALADEVQNAARRLEQLTREAPRQDVTEAARRLQDAADAMRRAAASQSRDGGAQAATALDRLREAQQRLERSQSGRAQREIQNAQRQAEELAADQKEIASEVHGLERASSARPTRIERLGERKDAMERRVANLEQQLDRLADDTRRDERDASRKLQEAASGIRNDKVKEKIRYSKGMLQGRAAEYARTLEEELGANLDALRQRVGEAASALRKRSKQDAVNGALEKTRDLVRGVESLESRARERADRANGQQAGAAGPNQGNGRPNTGVSSGAPQSGSAGGDAKPFGPGADDVRQFQREVREWTNEAQDLRRRLGEAGVDVRDLNGILRELRSFDNEQAFTDPRGLDRLHASVVEGLKKFEYGLRRTIDTNNRQLFLSGSEEVPAEFRPLVEEYYRSLAKKR